MLKKLEIGDFVEFVKRSPEQSGEIVLSESAKWYCAIVRPSRHLRAEFDLSRSGFRSFYPKARRWISHARVKKAVERPILNRYIFVEIDHPRQSFSTVNAMVDIESLVGNLGKPTSFPSHWIEGLLSRYMAGEWDEVAEGKLPVGARIRIVEGEFQDQLAIVTSSKGQRVNFKLIGAKSESRLNQCSVRAA